MRLKQVIYVHLLAKKVNMFIELSEDSIFIVNVEQFIAFYTKRLPKTHFNFFFMYISFGDEKKRQNLQ